MRQAAILGECGNLPFRGSATGVSDARRSPVSLSTVVILIVTGLAYTQIQGVAAGQEPTALDARTLEQVKAEGALRSSYRTPVSRNSLDETPQANLKAFRNEIEPILREGVDAGTAFVDAEILAFPEGSREHGNLRGRRSSW